MSASKVLRLAKLINEDLHELMQHGEAEDRLRGFQTLSARIRRANPPDKKWHVDRRKLQRITEHDEYLKLSVNQWIALDRYFTKRGVSFSETPLFERNILDPLGDTGHVCFFLGSVRSDQEHRNNVRVWDCRSMATLLPEIGKSAKGVGFEIQDVRLDEIADIRKVDEEPWYQYLTRPRCSVVAIGSPRICVATEVLLAEIFGVPRFRPNPSYAVPFRFIWAEGTMPYQSSFSLKAEQLPRPYRAVADAVARGESDAFMVGSQVHEFPRVPKNYRCPAVIVAQRRRDKRVWMVVAGLSGPATFAAAKFLAEEVTDSLPLPSERGQHGPVLWAVLMVPVRGKSHGLGDNRTVGGAEWVISLTQWRRP